MTTTDEEKITARQFAEGYAEKSGVTLQYLADKDWAVIECDCDHPTCRGWTMESRDCIEDHDFYGGPITEGPVYYLTDMVKEDNDDDSE
jgi:hypothetical protein